MFSVQVKKKNSESDTFLILKYDISNKIDHEYDEDRNNFWEFYKFSTWINAILYEDFHNVETIPKSIVPFSFPSESSQIFTNPALLLQETKTNLQQKSVHFLLNLHKLLTTSKQIYVRKKMKLYWDNLTQIEISNKIIPKLEKSILENASENFVPGAFFDLTTSKFLNQLMLPVSLKMNGKIDLVIGFEQINAPLQSFSTLNENNNYEYGTESSNDNSESNNNNCNSTNLDSNREGHTYWNSRSLFTPLEAYIYAKFVCPEPTPRNWLVNLQ